MARYWFRLHTFNLVPTKVVLRYGQKLIGEPIFRSEYYQGIILDFKIMVHNSAEDGISQEFMLLVSEDWREIEKDKLGKDEYIGWENNSTNERLLIIDRGAWREGMDDYFVISLYKNGKLEYEYAALRFDDLVDVAFIYMKGDKECPLAE